MRIYLRPKFGGGLVLKTVNIFVRNSYQSGAGGQQTAFLQQLWKERRRGWRDLLPQKLLLCWFIEQRTQARLHHSRAWQLRQGHKHCRPCTLHQKQIRCQNKIKYQIWKNILKLTVALASSDESPMGKSRPGEQAPGGERTVTLGTRLGVFFTACLAGTKTNRLHFRLITHPIKLQNFCFYEYRWKNRVFLVPWYAASVAFLFTSASSSSCFLFLIDTKIQSIYKVPFITNSDKIQLVKWFLPYNFLP